MLKILISYMLGPFGMMLENWYINNSLLINSVVVLYGILLVVSHLNYKKILDCALQHSETERKNNKFDESSPYLWARAIEEGSFFPLVSGSVSLLPKRANVDGILSLTVKDKRWRKIIGEVKESKKKK